MAFTPRDGQTLYPSPEIEMFELDLTPIGLSKVYRIYNGKWERTAFSDIYFPVPYRNIIAKSTYIYAGTLDSNGSTNGAVNDCTFESPSGCAMDENSVMYVADAGNHNIRLIENGVVSLFAGGAEGYQDGAISSAEFKAPSDVAISSAGDLFITDTGNNVVRKISGGVVSTLAGVAGESAGTDGTGAGARFGSPRQIAMDTNGDLYISDTNCTIRKVTPAGVVTTVAGLAGTTGDDDGTGASARFHDPYGIAIASDGNLYVADTANKTIRKVTKAGVVTTLAGVAGEVGNVDGTGDEARFVSPIYVRVGLDGNLYVLDYGPLVRRVTMEGVVTTVGILVEEYAVGLSANLFWNNKSYIPCPVKATGFEVSSSGTIPRPKLSISTLGTIDLAATVRANGDLVGATLTRRRTLKKYLDAINFDDGNANADPLWEKVDIYQVAQKTLESPQEGIIEWELRAAWDMEGKMVPKRIIQASACGWKSTDTAICPYVATCGKTLADCKTNYPSGSLPYGGFPGSGLASL